MDSLLPWDCFDPSNPASPSLKNIFRLEANHMVESAIVSNPQFKKSSFCHVDHRYGGIWSTRRQLKVTDESCQIKMKRKKIAVIPYYCALKFNKTASPYILPYIRTKGNFPLYQSSYSVLVSSLKFRYKQVFRYLSGFFVEREEREKSTPLKQKMQYHIEYTLEFVHRSP